MSWLVVVAACVVAFGALAVANSRRWRRMASRPGCASEEAFLARFEGTQISAELLRATFENLRQGMPVNFPVDPSDDLGAVFGIHEEDLDDLVKRLASTARRSLIPPEAVSGLPAVRTVEDLVRFVTSLPSQP